PAVSGIQEVRPEDRRPGGLAERPGYRRRPLGADGLGRAAAERRRFTPGLPPGIGVQCTQSLRIPSNPVGTPGAGVAARTGQAGRTLRSRLGRCETARGAVLFVAGARLSTVIFKCEDHISVSLRNETTYWSVSSSEVGHSGSCALVAPTMSGTCGTS